MSDGAYGAVPGRAQSYRNARPPPPAPARGLPVSCAHRIDLLKETVMGKYLIAWILGVPAFVLVLIYMFMH